MTTQTTKVRNGNISLPEEIRKSWKGADVFIFPSNDTLIVKKIQKPLEAEWQKYESKLKKSWRKLSTKTIDKAVNWAKSHS